MQIETGNLDTIPRLHWAAFRQAYPGDEHLHLACHAAFPIALTTDLLYKIWLNFRKTTTAEDPLELLSTVSDLLHSDLCREVGRDMYEMQADIRELLISTLQTSEAFGEARVFELARFLRDYLQYNPEKIPTLAFKEAQNWLVASYLEPEKAAKLILDLLQQEEENPDAGIKIDYFLSWAKERNKLNQVSDSTGDALLTAEQMVLGIRQYKAGDLEGALERLRPLKGLLTDEREKVGKGFKTKIPTEVWSALMPRDTGNKVMSLALQLIEQEKKERTGFLDLGNCGLSEVPEELFELVWLEQLNFSQAYTKWDNEVGRYQRRYSTNAGRSNSFNVIPLAISKLSNLQLLNISGEIESQWALNDLSPLSSLKNLRSLAFSYTQVSDLTPLNNLSNLEGLAASSTKVQDLYPLQKLSKLKRLYIDNTEVFSISSIATLAKLEELNIAFTNIEDISSLSSIMSIKELNIAKSKVFDLSPLRYATNLRELNCSFCEISDMSSISNLSELRGLSIRNTNISNINNIYRLQKIRYLDISNTWIKDISGLKKLIELEILVLDGLKEKGISFPFEVLSLPKLGFLSANNSDFLEIPKELKKEGNMLSSLKKFYLDKQNSDQSANDFENSPLSLTDFQDIIDDIKNQRAILILGPDYFRVDGESTNKKIRQKMFENASSDIAYFYEKNNLYIFSSIQGKLRASRQMRRFYDEIMPDETIMQYIVQTPFHVVLSLSPDSFVSEAFQRYGVEHRFHYFQHRFPYDKNEEIEKPSKISPLIYNLFGSIHENDSLVLDFDDLYKMVQSILGTSSLPNKLLRAFREAGTYIFLGFQFDKWYAQLLLKLLSDGGRGEKLIAINSDISDHDLKHRLLLQFNIVFVENEFDVLGKIFQSCSNAKILRDIDTV